MEPWTYRPATDHGVRTADRRTCLVREAGSGEWLVQLAWWALVRTYLRVSHRLAVEGREHLPPEPPYVIVANHTSHLDALVLGAVLPHRLRGAAFPIAAGDTFFRTPMASTLSALLLNALPMWRRSCGPHALETLRERLARDRCVYILFPEGTRARDGQQGPFRAGLGRLVAGTQVPVVPCSIRGAFDAWPPHRRRPSAVPVSVRIGPPRRFPDVPDARHGWNHVALDVASAVRALHEPTPAPAP